MNINYENLSYDGETLRVRADKLGLRPEAVASAAGCSLSTVLRAFKGENLEIKTLFSILRVLGLRFEIKEAA